MFSQAKSKLVVYTHLFLATDRVQAATVDDIVTKTRETYRGPLEVGEDLMSFDIGDMVTVQALTPRSIGRWWDRRIIRGPNFCNGPITGLQNKADTVRQ